MSLPTFYSLKNAHGDVMSQQCTAMWSMFPLQKAFNREAFDEEAGEILTRIINKLAEDSAGPSALAQATSLESSGGVVSRNEFHVCLESYVISQQRIRYRANSTIASSQDMEALLTWTEGNIASARKAQATLGKLVP